ncbi:PAB-dependent poly(A)-specific ribonuclease subunit PAN2 [Leucoagaricus sp. SymC.cos]|nr:PAB-dependent poly(A)-specific ribonuclease subunit PAN2 [Leucoagaricus sp. SymC.cos]
MSTSYHPINPVSTGITGPVPITALSFDPVSDILWAGANNGVITAIYTSRGYRGVFFPVGGNLAVSKISAGDNYVRAVGLASDGLGSWAKGGMNKWFHRSPAAVTTFSDAANSSHSLVFSTAGLEMLFLNSMTGNVVRKVPTSSVITHLQFSSSALISGSADGYIRLHDPRTGLARSSGSEHKVVKAHQSSIQGLQTTGNYIFTLGHSERQSRPFPDPLVKVYDVRTMRALPPMPFSSPAFIHVLPKRSSSIAVVSNQGLIHIMDATNLGAPSEFYQLNVTSYVTSMSISPTGTYMALGDADGNIHLMSQAEEGSNIPFNGFDGQPITWIDAPASLPTIEWTDSTPLNTVGVPYFDSPLFSAWTPLFTSANSTSYPPPPKIPPQILSTMKMNDNIAYAAMPKELKGRRNAATVVIRKPNGRFRSVEEVPTIFRKVEIEYSKFGVEDFDFGFYNKTAYSGLETHILNSYTNPVVQVMHYLLPVRRLAKSHITTNCPRENCLLCELGFVVRMLEDARGTNCQTSNFCKVVGALAQSANAIELIDYGRELIDVDYAHKIQVFNRFLIDHLSTEGSMFPSNPVIVKRATTYIPQDTFTPPPITQLMGIDGKNVVTCMNCKNTREKEGMTHIVDLMYPRKINNEQPFASDFAGILRNSVLRNISHKATCPSCRSLANFTSKRYIPSRDLPPVLVVNANVYNEETWEFWQDNRNKTFLQPQVKLHGQVDGIDDEEIASYIIGEMNIPLIAIVYLIPAIIYLERSNMQSTLDLDQLPDHMDVSILYQDTSIALHRDNSLIKQEPLLLTELPTPGTVVAIDAEFVKMQQEESEFRSDGTTRVIRPARLSLARVSVLRGDGPRAGVPLIDEHIHTSEIIVDYLTEFSGINPGDLDPAVTRMTLTPLKVAYKKLRLLVDRGCIFIGHGLSKDFRIINIYVPPEQVIDTVDLYFLKSRQRRLSLRFLSWFVLGEHIQQETHDSIEDARSALRLYNAFQSFEEQGIFDQKLEELYKEGRQYSFKPPITPSQQVNPAPTDHISSPLPTPSAPYFNPPTPIFDAHFAQMYGVSHPMGGYPLHRPQTNRNWRR